MNLFREPISTQLLEALRVVTDSGPPVAVHQVSDSVRELWRIFTRERTRLGQNYLERVDLLTAYLHYYFPINYAKVQSVLRELPPLRSEVSAHSPMRVLDVGSGPGTASLAALEWLLAMNVEPKHILVTAVDQSSHALAHARMLWKAFCGLREISGGGFRAVVADMARSSVGEGVLGECGGPLDLIVIANALNEWFPGHRDPVVRRAKVVRRLLESLAPDGALVIIEPALREPTRALHALRDQLLTRGVCSVYSPCLHDQPCPALTDPTDWCHEERPWQTPPSIQAFDRALGFVKDALKFSYVVLRKDGRTIVPRSSDLIRIVSEQRAFKGELRMWACGETGRRDLGRLERERSETNAAYDHATRGTIIRVRGAKRKEGATLERIPADAIVQIIRPLEAGTEAG